MQYLKTFKYAVSFFIVLLCLGAGTYNIVLAQDTEISAEQPPQKAESPMPDPVQAEPEAESEPQQPQIKKLNKYYPSLFFTYWQHQAIRDVLNSRGFVKAPTEAELNAEDEFIPDRGIRELKLGGILFKNEKEWIIYLNNERVKPDSIPEQILDLIVFEKHIELKWLDEHSNMIYRVRLKPHQRFNLDQRIFLSGD